jgi:GTP-binding protein Era
MNKEASDTLGECDLITFIVDISQPPGDEDRQLSNLISGLQRPIPGLMILNKVDRLELDAIAPRLAKFKEIYPAAAIYLAVSATRGDQLDQLLNEIINLLPEGPLFFPSDQITDLYEREIAADLIREAALNLLREEVPHGIAIRIDQFTERDEHGAYIEATIFVERESHKGIVIGKRGNMVKQIGSYARQEIEAMSGRRVFLRLRVKVRKNWRNDERILRWFGY